MLITFRWRETAISITYRWSGTILLHMTGGKILRACQRLLDLVALGRREPVMDARVGPACGLRASA